MRVNLGNCQRRKVYDRGSKLFGRKITQALTLVKAQGADQLYVSATPSESAIDFYLSQGFALAKQVHKDLYALEPEDIHLLRQL